MKVLYFIAYSMSCVFLIFGCASKHELSNKNKLNPKKEEYFNISQDDDLNQEDDIKLVDWTIDDLKDYERIWYMCHDIVERDGLRMIGYRFTLTGDFDGDSLNEQLEEHFFADNKKKETFQYLSSNDVYENDYVTKSAARRPSIVFSSSSRKIPTLTLSSNEELPLTGVEFAQVLGNIDDVPGDEVLISLAGMQSSNIGEHVIFTLHGKHWEKLFAYNMRIGDQLYPSRPLSKLKIETQMNRKYKNLFINEHQKEIERFYENQLQKLPKLVIKVGFKKMQFTGCWESSDKNLEGDVGMTGTFTKSL